MISVIQLAKNEFLHPPEKVISLCTVTFYFEEFLVSMVITPTKCHFLSLRLTDLPLAGYCIQGSNTWWCAYITWIFTMIIYVCVKDWTAYIETVWISWNWNFSKHALHCKVFIDDSTRKNERAKRFFPHSCSNLCSDSGPKQRRTKSSSTPSPQFGAV